MLYDALLYDELESNLVQCKLCAHRCKISAGSRGICRVRENTAGKLYTRVYGNLISKNIDPIEKKPLYHFYPGSQSYSVAMPGCNFRCEWCQNWQISQMPRIMDLPPGSRIMPDEIVQETKNSGCRSISYTYTEPTIFFEYSLETAKLAHANAIKNVYVTNGFMTPEMLDYFYPYLDAANVDIKAFQDATYRKLMGGRLAPVLESCKLMKSQGIWLEITTLIVPGVNDGTKELQKLASFILESLGPETPWHLSRYFPQYKMTDRSPTNETVLNNTKEMAESMGLQHVYLGNVVGKDWTKCKVCGHELIQRGGFAIRLTGLNLEGACNRCGTILDGVGIRGETTSE